MIRRLIAAEVKRNKVWNMNNNHSNNEKNMKKKKRKKKGMMIIKTIMEGAEAEAEVKTMRNE